MKLWNLLLFSVLSDEFSQSVILIKLRYYLKMHLMNNSRMDLNKAIKLALEILKSILSYFKITLRKTSF